MKTKLTYIVSAINKSLAFEWLVENLNPDTFEISFILLNPKDSELENYLRANSIPCEFILYRGKKDLFQAVIKIRRYLRKTKTDIVHCHLFDAGLAGLIAAKLNGINKRIYTRHHSDLHHVYFPHAIKYDKLINYFASDIIAISSVVKSILLKEGVPEAKIQLIHHGFPLSELKKTDPENVNRLKNKYNPTEQQPVIGVISRYTEWKGIQFIIPAFEKLLLNYPNALLILANAHGDYKHELKILLEKIPKTNYCEIEFEVDVFSLYKLFDVFIHAPITTEAEAFGQTYIECMIMGVPLIATKSGIANEILKNNENALIVPYKDSDKIYVALCSILSDETLKARLIESGIKTVNKQFSIEVMIQKLETLYLR